MKSTDIFPSKYLRATDLDGREPIVTIDRVTTETLGDDSKPVMYFTGKEKGLVMNKTNWTTVEELTGEDDSDNWRGHKIKLITVKVEFQGKRVPAIRIEEVAKPKPTRNPDHTRTGKMSADEQSAIEGAPSDFDDDQVPF